MSCRVVNVCSKVVGERQANLCELYACRVVRNAIMIASDNSHVLAQHYELLPSGRGFRTPKFRTIRSKNSFIPKSIQLLDNFNNCMSCIIRLPQEHGCCARFV